VSRNRVLGAAATVAAAAVAVALLGGCSSQSAPSGEPAAATTARVATFAAGDREPAPALSGPTLTGTTFDLAAQRGKVVVINVWGSWCGPCRAETPDLVRVANSTAASGVQFVGINTREQSLRSGQAFAQQFAMPYPSLPDPDGEVLVRFNETVPPSAVPSTILLDRQGRIAARALGAVTEQQLRDLLAPLVAEKA
jgi:thiol-disulfide isomerase/thioredoxin